jgi:hypothetical protein
MLLNAHFEKTKQKQSEDEKTKKIEDLHLQAKEWQTSRVIIIICDSSDP